MTQKILFKPIDSKVRSIGRTCLDANYTRWLGLSGSGVEFVVSKGSVSVSLVADSMYVSEPHRARFAVYVNDKLIVDRVLDEPEYVVTHEGFNDSYTVRVIKVSECAQSTIGISSITVESGAEVTPTLHKDKLIEFIGDSITCGYGVDNEDPTSKFTTATEDFRKSYAYLTAKALNCDYSMVSYSGYGIISGYTESDTPHPDILPPIYDKVGWSMGTSGDFSISNIKWDFSKEPDIVVINLGTNDATYVKDHVNRADLFSTKYVEFLKVVRSKYPNAPIICSLGIMGDSLYPAVVKAVRLYAEETLDNNISSIKFDVQKPEDGYSTGYHPTHKTYIKASKLLTDYIIENIKY